MQCKFLRFAPNGDVILCGRARCPNLECQRKYARKESSILTRSFAERPPNYFAVLKFDDAEVTPCGVMAKYLARFTQQVRDYRKATRVALEYDGRLEFDMYGQPHAHFLFITPAMWPEGGKTLIRQWWSLACQRPVKVHCSLVESDIAVAKYVTKDLKDRGRVRLPPSEWNGRKCRLNWQSRGFLARSKKAIWGEVVSRWYPSTSGVFLAECKRLLPISQLATPLQFDGDGSPVTVVR